MIGSPAYDPLDLATHADPYPAYRALREQRPLYRNDERGFWALSRYDDVVRAARDWRRFSAGPPGERSPIDAFWGIRPAGYVAADSDRHTVMRKLLQRDFGASAIARLEPAVRAIATDLVSRLEGRVDFATELAQPLPPRVLTHLLGVPEEDAPRLHAWNRAIWSRTPGETVLPDALFEADRELREYVRASPPTGGVLRTLHEARGTITDDELVDIGVLVIAAGTKTSSALIGIALQLLAERPELRERVVIPDFVEEVLRFDSPTQWFARVTTADVATEHGTIPAGERVLLLFGAANRDERRFPDPDRFDAARRPTAHLAFGGGIHHCLGAALARLEARVCLEVVLATLPPFEPDGEPERRFTPAERELASLPVRC